MSARNRLNKLERAEGQIAANRAAKERGHPRPTLFRELPDGSWEIVDQGYSLADVQVYMPEIDLGTEGLDGPMLED